MPRLLSFLTALLLWPSLALAQLPLTGAGLGAPASAPSSNCSPVPCLGDVTLTSGASIKAYYGVRPYTYIYSGNVIQLCLSSTGASCQIQTATNGAVTYANALGACNNSTNICSVKTLYDTSGQSNCSGPVACDMNQGGASYAFPLLVTSCIGAIPCISFDANGYRSLSGVAAMSALSEPWNIMAVYENKASSNRLLADNSSVGQTLTSGNFRIGAAGGPVSESASDNALHSGIGIAVDNTHGYAIVDAVSSTAGTVGVSVFPSGGDTIRLGQGGSFNGYFLEGGVYAGAALNASSDPTTICHNQYLYYGSTFATSC